MHRHDYRRTGRIKDAEKILAAAAHGALAVAALNVDIVAPLGLFLGDILMVLGAGVESCTSIPIEEKMMGVQK